MTTEERLRLEGAVIRKMRGIPAVLDHDHRWSLHPRPLCVDCGAIREPQTDPDHQHEWSLNLQPVCIDCRVAREAVSS